MIHALSANLDNLAVSRRMALSMVGYLSLGLIWRNAFVSDRPSRCHQPRDAGFHDQSMGYHSRWYYHPDQDTCHLFVYRGLGGNDNNFRTLHECHVECISKFCWRHFQKSLVGRLSSLWSIAWSWHMLRAHPDVVLRAPNTGVCTLRILRLSRQRKQIRPRGSMPWHMCQSSLALTLIKIDTSARDLFAAAMSLPCFLFLWCVELRLIFFCE